MGVESGKREGELIAQIEGKLDGLGKRIRIFKRAKSFVVSFALSHPLWPAAMCFVDEEYGVGIDLSLILFRCTRVRMM